MHSQHNGGGAIQYEQSLKSIWKPMIITAKEAIFREDNAPIHESKLLKEFQDNLGMSQTEPGMEDAVFIGSNSKITGVTALKSVLAQQKTNPYRCFAQDYREFSSGRNKDYSFVYDNKKDPICKRRFKESLNRSYKLVFKALNFFASNMNTNEKNTLAEDQFIQENALQEKISVIVSDNASSIDDGSRSSQAPSTRRLIGDIKVKKQIYGINKVKIPLSIIQRRCNNLNPSNGPVTHLNYDPLIFKDLDISAFGTNYISRNVFIYQNNATTPNITVDFKSITLQKKALKHKFSQGRDVQELTFYLPSVSDTGNSWLSIDTLLRRCASINIDIHLPIELKDPQNTITNLKIKNFNVNIMKNLAIYNHSGLNIKAINGNIKVYDLSARSVSLEIEEGGNMTGSIAEIQNELYASNSEGNYIDLFIKAINGKGSPRITAKTERGDLSFKFDNHTFSGIYNLTTKRGDIFIKYPDAKSFQKQKTNITFGTLDTVGIENLDSSLIANSTSGDIKIGF
ncbi:hypothetical protein G9A89_003412 [Geosiphon pyriformis]|nr:hypothetical protein G9A89_003412 [Geosiphon pyriformis]